MIAILLLSLLVCHAGYFIYRMREMRSVAGVKCLRCGYRLEIVCNTQRCTECGNQHNASSISQKRNRLAARATLSLMTTSALAVTIAIIVSGTWPQAMPSSVICKLYYASKGIDGFVKREYERRFFSDISEPVLDNAKIGLVASSKREQLSILYPDAKETVLSGAAVDSEVLSRQLIILEVVGFDDQRVFDCVLGMARNAGLPYRLRRRAAFAAGGARGACAQQNARLLTSAVFFEGIDPIIARVMLEARESLSVQLDAEERRFMIEIANRRRLVSDSLLDYQEVARRLVQRRRGADHGTLSDTPPNGGAR